MYDFYHLTDSLVNKWQVVAAAEYLYDAIKMKVTVRPNVDQYVGLSDTAADDDDDDAGANSVES